MLLYLLLWAALVLPLLPISLGIVVYLAEQRILRNKLPATLGLWSVLCAGAGMAVWLAYRCENATVYAAGYSEARFRQVATGMEEWQVVRLLGKPLEKWQPSQCGDEPSGQRQVHFNYSRSAGGDDYEMRRVSFIKGRVVEVIKYRYYD